MRADSAPRAVRPSSGRDQEAWRERSGRLFSAFERPAKTMVRRAFKGAFSADELDDIYAGAWVGTLRSLSARHAELADEEIRSYVLTAVANQASKELRRRRRKPTAPLELVGPVPDLAAAPDEQAARAEHASVTRDLLTSLPPRRRAVILLRYGWGLEPKQVCGLVAGLSPRAYRKEITRGVDEVAEKMRALESGDWCRRREPILKAFVAGVANDDQERQARAHLDHCRRCGEFVSRLRGHLHDLGGAVAASGAIEGLSGHPTLISQLADAGERARELGSGLASRAGSIPAEEGAAQIVTAGGARGAGVAGAGVLAKLAGIGTAGKLAAACLGGGAVATACIAVGVVPGGDLGVSAQKSAQVSARSDSRPTVEAVPAPATLPSQLDSVEPPAGGGAAAASPSGSERAAGAGAEDEPVEPANPVSPEAPPIEQEFGVAPAATPVSPAPSTGPSSGGGSSTARQEFAP